MSETATPAHKPLGQILLRRTLIGFALLLLILIPSVALFALTGQPVATYSAMGTLAGAVAYFAGGFRIGFITAIVISLLAPIAIVAGLSPVTGAALMALMTLMVGRMSRFGLHQAGMMVPIMLAWPLISPVPLLPRDIIDKVNELLSHKGMTLTDAVNKHMAEGATHTSSGSSKLVDDALTFVIRQSHLDSSYLLLVAGVFFVGAIFPVLVLPALTKKMTLPTPKDHTRSEALPYTITIMVLTTVATYVVLEHPKMTGGAFLIASILVLAQVGNTIKWKLTLERVLGTLAGVLIMMLIVQFAGVTTFVQVMGIPMPLGMYGIGLVFAIIAIIAKFSPRAWIYYVFIAPAAACLNAFSFSGAGNLGEQRFWDNLIGAGLVVGAGLITLAATKLIKNEESAE